MRRACRGFGLGPALYNEADVCKMLNPSHSSVRFFLAQLQYFRVRFRREIGEDVIACRLSFHSLSRAEVDRQRYIRILR